MRRTGKYWFLTLASTGLSLTGALLISLWSRKGTSNFELWFDVTFNGLGFASTLTSTLIVSRSFSEDLPLLTSVQGDYCVCLSRRHGGCNWKYVPRFRMKITSLTICSQSLIFSEPLDKFSVLVYPAQSSKRS